MAEVKQSYHETFNNFFDSRVFLFNRIFILFLNLHRNRSFDFLRLGCSSSERDNLKKKSNSKFKEKKLF